MGPERLDQTLKAMTLQFW